MRVNNIIIKIIVTHKAQSEAFFHTHIRWNKKKLFKSISGFAECCFCFRCFLYYIVNFISIIAIRWFSMCFFFIYLLTTSPPLYTILMSIARHVYVWGLTGSDSTQVLMNSVNNVKMWRKTNDSINISTIHIIIYEIDRRNEKLVQLMFAHLIHRNKGKKKKRKNDKYSS